MPEETNFPNPWVFDPRIRRTDDDVYYIAREILVAVEHEPMVRTVLRELGARPVPRTGPLDAYVTRYVLPLNDDGSEPDVVAVVRILRDLPGGPRVGPNHAFAADAQPVFPITGQPKLQGGTGDDPRPVGPLPGTVAAPGRVVRVAVVDTGLDPDAVTLPVFRNHQRHGRHEPDAVYENRSARRIGLMGGHGTAVASIVARYASQVQLSSVQVLNVAGTTDEWTLAAGLLRARDAGAEIINLSLGGVYDGIQEPVALQGVLDDLPDGTVVVAAAGNCAYAQPYFYPACRRDVVSVAAVDTTGIAQLPPRPDTPAGFSNTGAWITACAPGVRAHLAYVFGTWDYGAAPIAFQGYASWSGTSFSTPYVSARIAAATGPKDTAAQGRDNLLNPLPALPFQDYGRFVPAPPDFWIL